MTKLTEETKKKAEKLRIKNFLQNNDFVFELYPKTSITVSELKKYLSQFKDNETILFGYGCSIDYDYGNENGYAELDHANLLVRQTEELSEEEVLKEISKIELKKSKNKVAALKRKEKEKKNKEKKIKQLELELEKLKGTK